MNAYIERVIEQVKKRWKEAAFSSSLFLIEKQKSGLSAKTQLKKRQNVGGH